MKLFSWVHNKLNGKQGINNAKIISPPIKREEKEEFSDWPQAFLSIGTLGNKDLKEEDKNSESDFRRVHADSDNSQNSEENLTLEQIRELQNELNALVSNPNLEEIKSYIHDHDDDQQKHFATINGSNNNITIGKKSVSFILKKMFICGSAGLGPTPSLKDHTILSPPHSRMEKILRALLNKKIHPQNPSQTISKNKYLGSRQITSTDDHDDDDDDDDDQGNEGIKWVKTDKEYIVLEI